MCIRDSPNAISKVALSEEDAENYKNPDNDPRGPWAVSYTHLDVYKRQSLFCFGHCPCAVHDGASFGFNLSHVIEVEGDVYKRQR